MGRESSKSSILATVQMIEDGKHGKYVVTTSESVQDGSITFSEDAWDSDFDLPEPGTIVVLDQVFLKSAGWRAMHARPYTPNDTLTQTRRRRT